MKTAIQCAMISGLVLGLVACGGVDSLDSESVADVEVLDNLPRLQTAPQRDPLDAANTGASRSAPDGSLLVGTWSGEVISGQFSTLVLMSDQRFYALKALQCAVAPCKVAESEGTYTLQLIDGRLFIDMSVEQGEKAFRYEVAADDSTLRLRSFVSGASWYEMTPANVAWCSESSDCYAQNLPLGVRADKYDCVENACVLKNIGAAPASE